MDERMTREQLITELLAMRQEFHVLEACRQEMQISQAKYATLLESAPDAMLFVGRDSKIVTANAQMEKLFGYAEEELVGRDLHQLIPERYRAGHRASLAAFFSSPRARPMGTGLEILGLKKDGSEFPADISLSPLEAEGELLAIASIRDITDRKLAELQIERNYQVQRAISSILQTSLEPIGLDEHLDMVLGLILAIPGLSRQPKGSIYLVENEPEVLVLKASRGYTDTAPPCGKVSFGDCLCGDAAANQTVSFAGCLDERHTIGRTNTLSHGHHCVPIVSAGQTLGLIDVNTEEGHERAPEEEAFLVAVANTLATVIVRRQTEAERNRLKEELAETEKLTALGRMTANVAHEIRNPLTAIGGFARRLDRKLLEGSKEKQYAAFIVEEVGRLEGILRDILSFSRGSSPRRETCDIRSLVEEGLRIFVEACKERSISIRRSFHDVAPIAGDNERILEVVENLISNAIDAMPGGGELAITTGSASLKGVPYATITVSDTGEGIRDEDLPRIFEPFFTTKISPKGVGLGLPIVKKFMEDHGGLIDVKSRVGTGTTFVLYFPYPESIGL
jgi:PAS domain S-box-containing protein